MRKLAPALLALACWWLVGAGAQEAEEQTGPDLDFLEYLGAWAEDDDEWLAIEEWQRDQAEAPDEEPKEPEQEKDDDDEGQ
jgi:hypothetical protein